MDDMTYSSCIRHPEKTRYIQVYDWQIQFCQGNHCAAILLSFFINWHDWKLRHDQYYKRANDIAEMHGDGRPHVENGYLFFTTDDLIKGCMEFYGKQAINTAIDLLTTLCVITVHKNPNPRYHFDKTKYFKLYPNVCNRWIASNHFIEHEDEEQDQEINFSDSPKMADREAKNGVPSNENRQPSKESDRAITDTTNNTTNKIQSINARDDVQLCVDALTEKGMSAKRFYPEALEVIRLLGEQGATTEMFVKAYDIAHRTTKNNHYGMNYLAKIVEQLLTQSIRQHSPCGKSPTSSQKDHFSDTVYESDIRNAVTWMKGTDECRQE